MTASPASHIYKEISPNSILISGGQTTVANLFYNMARRTVGLVGVWDVVAFDEVAGISFKDKDGVQIMKDYMASGSFARGRDAISAYAAMVFVGNWGPAFPDAATGFSSRLGDQRHNHRHGRRAGLGSVRVLRPRY